MCEGALLATLNVAGIKSAVNCFDDTITGEVCIPGDLCHRQSSSGSAASKLVLIAGCVSDDAGDYTNDGPLFVWEYFCEKRMRDRGAIAVTGIETGELDWVR